MIREGHIKVEEGSLAHRAFEDGCSFAARKWDCLDNSRGLCYTIAREAAPVLTIVAGLLGLAMEWGEVPETCVPPQDITKYGVNLRAGDESDNWLDIEAQDTPITVEGDAEFFIFTEDSLVEIDYPNLAAIFKTDGFIVRIRPYSLVGDLRVETAGEWTGYTCTPVFPVDPATQASQVLEMQVFS